MIEREKVLNHPHWNEYWKGEFERALTPFKKIPSIASVAWKHLLSRETVGSMMRRPEAFAGLTTDQIAVIFKGGLIGMEIALKEYQEKLFGNPLFLIDRRLAEIEEKNGWSYLCGVNLREIMVRARGNLRKREGDWRKEVEDRTKENPGNGWENLAERFCSDLEIEITPTVQRETAVCILKELGIEADEKVLASFDEKRVNGTVSVPMALNGRERYATVKKTNIPGVWLGLLFMPEKASRLPQINGGLFTPGYVVVLTVDQEAAGAIYKSPAVPDLD